jgi:hypothetical protein
LRDSCCDLRKPPPLLSPLRRLADVPQLAQVWERCLSLHLHQYFQAKRPRSSPGSSTEPARSALSVPCRCAAMRGSSFAACCRSRGGGSTGAMAVLSGARAASPRRGGRRHGLALRHRHGSAHRRHAVRRARPGARKAVPSPAPMRAWAGMSAGTCLLIYAASVTRVSAVGRCRIPVVGCSCRDAQEASRGHAAAMAIRQ